MNTPVKTSHESAMRVMRIAAGLFLLGILAPGYSQSGQTPFEAPAGPYVGQLQVEAHPRRGGAPMRGSGSGSAELQHLAGDRFRLIVHGNMDGVKGQDGEAGNAGFVIDGRMEQEGWFANEGGIQIAINRQGYVTGEGLVQGDRYQFSGLFSAASAELEVAIQPGAAPGATKGPMSSFRFIYQLARHDADKQDDTPSTSERHKPGGCRHIVYQPRMIANIGGGMMSSVQVPVCVP